MSDSRRETSLSLSGQNRPSIMEVVQVDDIPVLVARPDQTGPSDRLALWLHFLGGNKEAMAPFLQQLAAAGVTAVSFDAWNTANGLSSRWLT
jgi:predicted esterase